MITPVKFYSNNKCKKYPWHPSVVYSKNGWSGHKYWMAQTPMPPFYVYPYRDRYELPCIHFSDDGIHWFPINSNPIDDLSVEEIQLHHYFSDTHLLLVDSCLICFYRYMSDDDKRTIIYQKHSFDSINWSNRQLVFDTNKVEDHQLIGDECISPAFVCMGGKMMCWFVDDTWTNYSRGVSMIESNDGLNWSKTIKCVFYSNGLNLIPWHIDCQYIDSLFLMTIFDEDNGFIALYKSSDGINFYIIQKLLSASNKKFDYYEHSLYRSCLIKTTDKFLIYFSATNKYSTYIGLLESDSVNNKFSLVDCLHGIEKFLYILEGIANYVYFYVHKLFLFIKKKYDF